MLAEIPPLPSQSELEQESLITVPQLVKRIDLLKEWNRIFGKKLVPGERLVRVFRCAIAKPTLMEGKLWLSEHHISFKLNWPGQTCIVIGFDDVVDIRKSSFANIVPNAIEVETTTQSYFFGSLTGRGEKFIEMNLLWDQHVDMYSLFRKFPNLSVTPCVCPSDERNCDVCVKKIEMEKADPQNKRGMSKRSRSNSLDSPLRKSETVFLEVPENNYARSSRSSVSIILDDEDQSDVSPPDSPRPVEVPEPLPKASGLVSASSTATLSPDECKCAGDSNYKHLVQGLVLPFSLEVLWKEWFAPGNGGNTFIRFLIESEGITDIELAPWANQGDESGKETVPLEEIGCTGNYTIPFKDVKTGMYRKTSRVIPVKHGIPFVPKVSPALNTFIITSVSDHHLAVQNDAVIALVGIHTNLKICLNETSENECKLDLYVNLDFTGKGKISVPRSLAEKGTLDGIKTFYLQFKEYLQNNVIVENQVSHCTCEQTEGYSALYISKYLPISIDTVWKEIFMALPEGNAFSKFLEDDGSKELRSGPWSKDEKEELCVGIEKAIGEGYAIPFSNLQIGMGRKIKYDTVNPDPKPFVPTMLPCVSTQKVIGHTPHSLCIDYKSRMKGFGVEKDFKFCINALGRHTQIKVFGKVVVQKGRYPVPALWQDPYATVKASLSKLFDEFLVGAYAKDELARGPVNDLGVGTLDYIIKIVKASGTEEYSKYLILFVFVILLINTMIMWNLVIAAERNQRQILALTKLLVEANSKL